MSSLKKSENLFPVAMSLEDLECPKTLKITNQGLGAGGFGSVFVCGLGGDKVAAKKLSQSKREIDNLINEASRLKKLQYGKHIAYTYGITLRNENLYMVMEYSEHGDLQNYLKKNKEVVTYEQKILFCRGILLGLLYCHSMKVFHGDIKCSNVILGKNLEPKLTGFGLSMTVDNIEGYCKTYEGSIHWAAPELFSIEDESGFEEFKANPYPTDVYSLGATFCQVSFDGTTEFIDSDNIEMDISLGLVSPAPRDGFLEEIVDKCCQFERNERISLDESLAMLENVAEARFQIPAIDDKWQIMEQDIKANSRLKLPPLFILHRPAENLVVGPSNLSLLELLCINNHIDAVKHIIPLHKYDQDQDQIKWLHGISELCKSLEVADFLQGLMQNNESSRLILSSLIDNHPQQFVEMLIKAEASCCSYNLLKRVIKRHHNMAVKAIIDSGNNFKDWAIHDAINFGNVEAVKMLANAGADLGWISSRTGYAPLKTAIDTESIEIVKYLLEFGVDINDENNLILFSMRAENQHKPLHLAVLKDNREIVEVLMKAGAIADIESYEWRSLSKMLEKRGNVSMMRFICNSISKRSNPVEIVPVCAAIQNKQLDLVQTLIDNRANIDEIGLDGYAPLHWAVIVDDEKIVKTLVSAGVDLDTKISNEAQSLRSASASDYFSKCTPLHIAVSKKHWGIARFLIKSGADFSAKNQLQQTVMDTAKEDKKLLEKVIRECVPANIVSIRRAIKSMNLEGIKAIIENQRIDTEVLSECLCIAAKNGENNIVQYLLKREANFNEKHQSKTPLEWAMFGGNIETMKIFINAGTDINAKNPDGKTLLTRSVMESNTEVVQFLVNEGADVNSVDMYGDAPIHYAKDKEIMEILINAGADINAENQYGEKIWIQCIKESNIEMVQFLVDRGVDVNARNEYGNTPIHYANDEGVMKILISAGANIDIRNQHGETPLIQYVKKSNAGMVQFLVGKGADVNIRDRNGNTAIRYAKDKEVIEILTNAGARIDIQNGNEMTSLTQYIKESNAEMVRLLVDNGADVNVRDKDNCAPIHFVKDKEIAEILINADADIDAKDQGGETPLIRYVKESNTGMIQFLIDKGVNVNARSRDGYAPIHYVNEEIIEILNNAGARVDIQNEDEITLLFQSIRKQDTEVVQSLVNEGVNVNTRDKDGNAPIHCTNNKEIMEILINAGANIDAKNQYGKTLFIEYIRKANEEMVKFLIGKGADLNATDKNGNIPVYFVRDKEIAEILIDAGTDINVRNEQGEGLFNILMREQNRDLSNRQYKRKKVCKLLEYLRDINKN